MNDKKLCENCSIYKNCEFNGLNGKKYCSTWTRNPKLWLDIVRKYFCRGCKVYDETVCFTCVAHDRKKCARAARAFVKAENKGKLRLLDMSNVEFEKEMRSKGEGKRK